MDLTDDDDHQCNQSARDEWGQEPRREQEPAAEFDEYRRQREEARGSEAHVAHGTLPAGKTRSAPPAEELLGAVGGEDEPYAEP